MNPNVFKITDLYVDYNANNITLGELHDGVDAIIRSERKDELDHMKFIDLITGIETFKPYLQYRCAKDGLLVDWDNRLKQLKETKQ